jgi:glucose/arabinose dehydrogenase
MLWVRIRPAGRRATPRKATVRSCFALFSLVAASCSTQPPTPSRNKPDATLSSTSRPDAHQSQTPRRSVRIAASPIPVCDAEKKCWPSAFDFTRDGKLFYAEQKTGRIFFLDPATRRPLIWARLKNVATETYEMGVVGIAVHPRWPTPSWLYVYYTRSKPFENRLVRIVGAQDGPREFDQLLTLPAGEIHNGGALDFGPDGLLYLATGEAGTRERSQNLDNPSGKLLRMRANGSAPRDNPFRDKRIFSYGHRNSYGFAFDPVTRRIWQTENGPTCNDEINIIRPGRNHGWGPDSWCPTTNDSGPDPVRPLRLFKKVIAPTGAVFCVRCGLGERVENSFLFGSWRDGRIRMLVPTRNRLGIASEKTIYKHETAVLTLRTGPNGILYFSDPAGIYSLAAT